MGLCNCVYKSGAPELAHEPDALGLAWASFSVSHLPFHSALTLVVRSRQDLTYIHPKQVYALPLGPFYTGISANPRPDKERCDTNSYTAE